MSRTVDKRAAAIVLKLDETDPFDLILDLQLINAEEGDMASVLNDQVEAMVQTMEMLMFGMEGIDEEDDGQ